MSHKASQFQYKVMSWAYRGKEIFKPLNTGWIDEHVACIREYLANIFFYVKGDTCLMIDAGYSYERLAEKMAWLDLDPACVHDVLVTHLDTDHVGALERDSDHLFDDATMHVGAIEHRYLTGEASRRVYWKAYKLPRVFIDNRRHLVADREVFEVGPIKVEAHLVPGHTWGHMVYLVDDRYLFTGDTIWFGPDGGYAFPNTLAEDNDLAVRSLAELRRRLEGHAGPLTVITGHTGFSDDLDFVFAHTDEVCHASFVQKPHDPSAPYDAFDESDDTEEQARTARLVPTTFLEERDEATFWNRCAFAYDLAMRSGDEGLSKLCDRLATYVSPTDVVLDGACGTGTFACALAPHVGFVGGVDLSEAMVGRARAKAKRRGLDNVAFGVGDLTHLDFADNTFDLTVAANVLHLLKNPEAALAELRRVTREEGTVVLPTYVRTDGISLIERLGGTVGFNVEHDWDEAELLAFIERSGLAIVEHRMFDAARPCCLVVAKP